MATVVPGQRTVFAPRGPSPFEGIAQIISQFAGQQQQRDESAFVQQLTQEYLNQDIPDIAGFSAAAAGILPAERISMLTELFVPKAQRGRDASAAEERSAGLRGAMSGIFGPDFDSLTADVSNVEDLNTIIETAMDRDKFMANMSGAKADRDLRSQLQEDAQTHDTEERIAGEDFDAEQALLDRQEVSTQKAMDRIFRRGQGDRNRENRLDAIHLRAELASQGGDNLTDKDKDVRAYAQSIGLDFEEHSQRNIARNVYNARDEISDQVNSEFTTSGILGTMAFLEGKDAQARNIVHSLAEDIYVDEQKAGNSITPAQAVSIASAAFETGRIIPESIAYGDDPSAVTNYLVNVLKWDSVVAEAYYQYLVQQSSTTTNLIEE